MNRSELVEGAIEVIEKYGWHQGGLGDTEHGFCLTGAGIATISGQHWSSWTRIPTILTAESVFVESSLSPFCRDRNIPVTNDYHLTTKEEAIDLLTKTAKYWRDKGL